ncbi:Fc.00g104400.m01.CDS01 [Cosmosporella sp. VM-42]
MATFAVSSRFAPAESSKVFCSPREFARHASRLSRGFSLSLDEIKACVLLCVHEMSISVGWDSVADIAKLIRMTELYHALCFEKQNIWRPKGGNDDCGVNPAEISHLVAQGEADVPDLEVEDWKSVWWCVYKLDTICSSVAAISHAFAVRPAGNMALPTVSVCDFTNSRRANEERQKANLQFIPTSGGKHWEMMKMIHSNPACRGRNLYLGACSLMRAVTELRFLARHNCGPAWRSKLRELESDCAATNFSMPPCFFNPARDFTTGETGETEEEHRQRLETLMAWRGASLALAICAARASEENPVGEQVGSQAVQARWQSVLSKANEVVQVVQNWKPNYFNIVDPMCSYIVLLSGSVLVLDRGIESENKSPSSPHLDLLMLFLGEVGRYWPIGNNLADSLQELSNSPPTRRTYHDAFRFVFQLTLQGELMKPPTEENNSPKAWLNARATNLLELAYPMTSGDFGIQLDGPFADLVDSNMYNYPWPGTGGINYDKESVDATSVSLLS